MRLAAERVNPRTPRDEPCAADYSECCIRIEGSNECGDALTVAAKVAEVEGLLVPLGPGAQPETPTTEAPGLQPPNAPLSCPGGSTWVYGGSCSRCFGKMKMVVGGSGTMTLRCDPGYTWTECSWSSC